MPVRNRNALAQHLGQRLAQSTWTDAALKATLMRTIPNRMSIDWSVIPYLTRRFPQTYAPAAGVIATALLDHPFSHRLFRQCQKENIWPTHLLSAPKMQQPAHFADCDIPHLDTTADLADWLLLPLERLSGFVDRFGRREEHGDMAVNHYFTRLQPKRSGDMRLIEAPKPRLKSFQRLIHHHILSQVPTHPDSFGFCAGRDCSMGAARHAGEGLVMRFDLADYFNRITYGRVFGLFRGLGYPAAVAHALTGLCTTITPSRIRAQLAVARRLHLRIAHLPQGAPTSPALSNILTYRLDTRLSGLARSVGANYSRYADDLTFSGDKHIRRVLSQAVPDIIKDEGFVANPAKTRMQYTHQRQQVTGVVVNAHLNIPRKDFDRIKAMIHARHWRHDPATRAQLLGHIAWVRQVNPAKGAKLDRLLAKAAT